MSMNARLRPPPGAYHRSAVNHALAALFADLAAARAADRQARCARHPAATSAADSMRLVTALRACAAGLELHQLPVPRTLRDELRLRRQLQSRS
jgi:hypothetical protein